MVELFDTHNHFDFPEFDDDRVEQARLASECGVRQLVMAGYVQRHFPRLFTVQNQLNQLPLQVHVALGLHPCFVTQHDESDLLSLANFIESHKVVAIGEIGLDTFEKVPNQAEILARQKFFFIEQLKLAVQYQLPVILHIRKAHADCLRILKQHAYDAHKLGGIAHGFSGGAQEGKAFVRLGFRLGVTGQICNPNAKKLRRTICAVVEEFGLGALVIETDCPDIPPLPYQQLLKQDLAIEGKESNFSPKSIRNNPANLPYVLQTLSELLNVEIEQLAQQLWYNSHLAFNLSQSNILK